MRKLRNAYKILVEKPKRKKPTGKPSDRGEGNIKMDHKEI
jgi:hypothetical protein